jgi:hypothetical protein
VDIFDCQSVFVNVIYKEEVGTCDFEFFNKIVKIG